MDSNVAEGSADKTRLTKKFYKALICFRIMNILESLTFDDTFVGLIDKLRVDPSPTLVGSVIAHPNFCNIRSAITATSVTFIIHVCKLP